MTASIEIRRAEAADAAALSHFAARLFRATYGGDTPAADLDAYVGSAFSAARQASEIRDPQAAIFLATANGAIIGYAHLVMVPGKPPAALLNRIYVDADWQGRGLAKDLLAAVLDACARHGAARLELTVYEKNARAMAFYAKVGFAVTGTTTFTVGGDIQTDIVMAMDLSANRDPGDRT